MKTIILLVILASVSVSAYCQGLPELQKSWAVKTYEKIQGQSSAMLEGEKRRVKAVFDAFWMNGSTWAAEEDVEELANLFGAEYLQKTFAWHYARQQGLKSADPQYDILVPPYEITVREDGYVCVDGCPEVDEGIYE